jgi:hypothetical protein
MNPPWKQRLKAALKPWVKPYLMRWWPHGFPAPVVPRRATDDPTFHERKARKLTALEPLLQAPAPLRTSTFFDYLTPELREQFRIVDTDNISAHDYDSEAERIRQNATGWILDCGAGLRGVYYDHVVNYEICDYATTDVRGVAEQLPFRDQVFSAVFCFNVLEHFRDPFAAARELIRVLAPGGELYVVVPFLQPYHAYPHHYYNMTAQGLANLFAPALNIERQEVSLGGWPIFMLTWVLRRWAESLPPAARQSFLKQRVGDLTGDPRRYLQEPFVQQLPEAAKFELGATTSLFARKPAS